jgi:hypothetical protein
MQKNCYNQKRQCVQCIWKQNHKWMLVPVGLKTGGMYVEPVESVGKIKSL